MKVILELLPHLTLCMLSFQMMTVIQEVQLHSPLGKSDHACTCFICDIEEVFHDSVKRLITC